MLISLNIVDKQFMIILQERINGLVMFSIYREWYVEMDEKLQSQDDNKCWWKLDFIIYNTNISIIKLFFSNCFRVIFLKATINSWE